MNFHIREGAEDIQSLLNGGLKFHQCVCKKSLGVDDTDDDVHSKYNPGDECEYALNEADEDGKSEYIVRKSYKGGGLQTFLSRRLFKEHFEENE